MIYISKPFTAQQQTLTWTLTQGFHELWSPITPSLSGDNLTRFFQSPGGQQVLLWTGRLIIYVVTYNRTRMKFFSYTIQT